MTLRFYGCGYSAAGLAFVDFDGRSAAPRDQADRFHTRGTTSSAEPHRHACRCVGEDVGRAADQRHRRRKRFTCPNEDHTSVVLQGEAKARLRGNFDTCSRPERVTALTRLSEVYSTEGPSGFGYGRRVVGNGGSARWKGQGIKVTRQRGNLHQRDLQAAGYPQPFANNGRGKHKCTQLER